ncbi:MAG TPA: thioredoxin domain-containing protein [Acidisarcina sp.]
MKSLHRTRTLLCCALLLIGAGCKAQTSPENTKIDRRIEVLVRSQFQVPADYSVTLGSRGKSDITGYDSLPITFSPPGQPDKQQTVTFLVSKDGNTLARLEKFDLTKDPRDAIATAYRPIRGTDSAKVTIVNFDDLECPYCARMHQELFPATLDHYKGLIKVVYKDDPLIEIHPWALRAAVDTNCLGDQSSAAYWSYVDYVHSHGQEISGPEHDAAKASATLDRLAREEGVRQKLDPTKLDVCLAKQSGESVVRTSMKEAAALGIDGTPAVFVNGERVNGGAVPTEILWKVIDRALLAAGEQPPKPTTAPGISQAPVQAPDGSVASGSTTAPGQSR